MRGRACWLLLVLVASTAAAEPKPKPVDIKPLRETTTPIVLEDADGGLYVVFRGKDRGANSRAFYSVGKTKPFYEQIVTGRSENGAADTWSLAMWAPRVPELQPGTIDRRPGGEFRRTCGNDSMVGLTEVSSDKAKATLDKGQFLTSAMVRRPYLFARDDAGVYYYVDVIRKEYGGNGHRVFIGKKGAMKQRPLVDVASDAGGDVFSTKMGDLRLVRDTVPDSKLGTVVWVKGSKRASLVSLDLDANSTVIFKDLGVYTFTGSICENL